MKMFLLPVLIMIFCISEIASAQTTPEVKISGAMKNVMRHGQLFGTINLDTISKKENVFGIGPLEYLKGELMIYEGVSYISRIAADGKVIVEQSWNAKAPFFVYAKVDKWYESLLPDSVTNLLQLEKYLYAVNKSSEPFAFKLEGEVEEATYHIINLPEGKKVSSPEEAHEGLQKFYIKNEFCNLSGFFSTSHQAVFTHHDTFIHVHIINDRKNKMGHLEEITFRKGTMKLFLPQ